MPTETPTPGFANPPLQRAVALGAVDASGARLWVRARAPIRVRWAAIGEAPREATQAPPPDAATRDHTFSLALPTDLAPTASLRADTAYRYQVEDAASAELIAAGGFRTAPQTAGDALLSFGLFSCNQPFEADGSVRAESAAMLRAARAVLRDHDARFALSIGDQMYTDAPADRSLFDPDYFQQVAPLARRRLRDCTPHEVRRLLHARYRHFFALPDWRALHHSLPIYPILDDHEVVDNWGSDPAHQTASWHSVGAGARAAYFDYQGARVAPSGPTPPTFDYAIDRPDAPIYVLDLRSQRRAGDDGRVIGPGQFSRLRAFLDRHADAAFAFVVCTVPPVHMPRWAASAMHHLTPTAEDFADRWSSGAHQRDRTRLLELFRDHQRRTGQRVVILAGDIHTGSAHELRYQGGETSYQFISSAITNRQGPLLTALAKASIGMTRSSALANSEVIRLRRLPGVDGCDETPYGDLNLGIVQVDPGAQRVRFKLYGHDAGEPRCVYASPWLLGARTATGVLARALDR